MKWFSILLAMFLAACGGGGNNPPPLPSAPNFTALYSTGIGRCDDFTFGELHYCVKQLNARVGQTIRMTFTLSGNGTLYPVEAADLAPATLRLFVSGDPSGYSTTRWWCPTSKTDLIVPGTYTVACTISSEWTGVGGGLPTPPIGGINYVGYTTGGQYFAGHGVAAKDGTVRMTINQYDVSDVRLLKRRTKKR